MTIQTVEIETLLFSLNTAGTVPYYFYIYIYIKYYLQDQHWITMHKTLHRRTDSLNVLQTTWVIQARDATTAQRNGVYWLWQAVDRAGESDHYEHCVIPWRKPHGQIYFNYRLKYIGCFFDCNVRVRFQKLPKWFPWGFFPLKINVYFPNHLRIYKAHV